MAKRYGDIERAPLLQQAYQNRQTYRNRPPEERGQNLGTRGNRTFSDRAVDPFGETLAATTYYSVRVSDRGLQQTSITSAITAARLKAIGQTDSILENGSFNPAKGIFFIGTGSNAPKTSDVTRLRYMKRGGSSYTVPFGKNGTSEREVEAVKAIKQAFTVNAPNNGFSYQPERLYFTE